MLSELLALRLSLWVQVGGMSASISFGMLIFSIHQSVHSNGGLLLVLFIELLIILFSISTFSVYLTKRGISNAEKLGLRKILGASGWSIFIEVAVRTTLLITLAIIISIAIIDVATWVVGLSFEHIIQSIGILQFGTLLLVVFIVSEGVMFIIIGVALAPTLKQSINKTTSYDKYWFEKLGKLLSKTSMLLAGIIAVLLLVLIFYFVKELALKILVLIFYMLLVLWHFYNKKQGG